VPLPEKIVTKVSSDQAGYLSVSRVERRELTPSELIERILAAGGKDLPRVQQVLRRGSLVSGLSRYRWAPLEVADEEVAGLLARFPDPDPERPFLPGQCHLAIFHGRRGRLELARETAEVKRWFRRRNFWQALLEWLEELSLSYRDYSYSQQADVYDADLSPQAAERIEGRTDLLAYSALAMQLRRLETARVEVFVRR